MLPKRKDFSGRLYLCCHGKEKKKGIERDNWLDYAEPKYGKLAVAEFKAVIKVGKVFLLYPFYWALYDQQVFKPFITISNHFIIKSLS